MKLKQMILWIAGALFASVALHATADTIELRGSTTVNSVLIESYKDQISSLSGQTLNVTPTNSGDGLSSLINFATDIAMTSAPFADVANQVGKTSTGHGLKVRQEDFQVTNLGKAEVLFVAHPSAKVASLTPTQLAGILTGKIKNWNEVGGNDLPVVVVTEQKTGAMRTEISKRLLNGADLVPGARVVVLATQAPSIVLATPGAIGFISSAHPKNLRQGLTVLNCDVRIEQNLYLITSKHPKPAVQRVVSAVVKIAKKTLSD